MFRATGNKSRRKKFVFGTGLEPCVVQNLVLLFGNRKQIFQQSVLGARKKKFSRVGSWKYRVKLEWYMGTVRGRK